MAIIRQFLASVNIVGDSLALAGNLLRMQPQHSQYTLKGTVKKQPLLDSEY